MTRKPMSDEQKAAQSARMKARWAEKKSQSPLDVPRPKHPVKDKYREPSAPPSGLDIIVTKKPDGDVRLFQSKPGRKEWLTKAEAEERGHVWVDNPGKAGVDKTLVRGVREED